MMVSVIAANLEVIGHRYQEALHAVAVDILMALTSDGDLINLFIISMNTSNF